MINLGLTVTKLRKASQAFVDMYSSFMSSRTNMPTLIGSFNPIIIVDSSGDEVKPGNLYTYRNKDCIVLRIFSGVIYLAVANKRCNGHNVVRILCKHSNRLVRRLFRTDVDRECEKLVGNVPSDYFVSGFIEKCLRTPIRDGYINFNYEGDSYCVFRDSYHVFGGAPKHYGYIREEKRHGKVFSGPSTVDKSFLSHIMRDSRWKKVMERFK